MADDKTKNKSYEEQYKDLLNDSNFEDLERELQKPNIFSILGINRKELKHSNILVWLLDPNESHGFGNRFLIRVLRDLATIEKNDALNIIKINKLNFSNVEVKREVSYSNNEKGSIDILIDFRDKDDKLVICIENKIDTTDSEGQLEKYQNFIDKDEKFCNYNKVFVYLTPYGKEPVNFKGMKKWYNYSYEKIINHLENIREVTINTTIKTYISDYLSTLKKIIMSTDDAASKLAQEIYKQHKDIIDFISDYRDTNTVNQQEWEDGWLIKIANKLLLDIQDIDKENEKYYELGFTKNYISIRHKGQRIYSLWPNNEPKFSLEINLGKNDNKQNIIDLLKKENIEESKSKDVFAINSFENILKQNPDILKKIHELRFGLNQ